jgi:hypothetical protein
LVDSVPVRPRPEPITFRPMAFPLDPPKPYRACAKNPHASGRRDG